MRRIENILIHLTIAKLKKSLERINCPVNQVIASLDDNFKKTMCETNKCSFSSNYKGKKMNCEECAGKWLEEEVDGR